jgi:parallel beta-helix repeat protein
MPLLQTCLSLVRKYGSAARVVAAGVLNVVAPGSGTLIEMAGQALDAAGEITNRLPRENWECELLARLGQSEAELKRLGQMLEFLTGPLAAVCDKAAAFANQADNLPDIIGQAIAADPSLAQVLHQIGTLKEQFAVFQADIRRLASRQEEAAPVYVRMNRVADYFEALWQAGIGPKDFVRLLHHRTRAVACIEQGQTGELAPLFLEMRLAAPKAASIPILEAAASVREFNYPAAQRALATALRLKPGDGELLELSQRVTTLTTRSTPSQPRPTAAPKRLQPGDTLDGWTLQKRLGAGGWGQVFKAVREGQTRALKVMHPDLAANRLFVERFKKEIAALHRLPRHANLVRIEDFGYCAQRQTWYLAMEYVDGPTLENYLARQGPLTETLVHQVFADVIDGLAQAHAAGIVHRDIKPGNLIFRRSDKRLVLVDFGLAVGAEDVGHTRVGGLTVSFAAPEQLYGEPATQASDVYSLCAVIHYALHSDKPEQRKPNRFSPALAPQSLREALTRGLTANAGERLANAGQLQEILQRDQLEPGSDPSISSSTQNRTRWRVALDGLSLVEAVQRACPGDVIEVAAGDYTLPQSLVIDKSLIIQGAGRDQTRIHSWAAGFAIRFSGDAEWTLRDVAVEHVGNQPANVVVVEGGLINLTHCSITGGVRDETKKLGGDGVWFLGSARGHVSQCLCRNNEYHGIAVTGQAQPVLEANTCENNKQCGILYFENAAGSARNNKCQNNEYHGIQVSGQAQPVLEANTCENNKYNGIAYFANAAGSARNNTCKNNAINGIYVGKSAKPTLGENILVGNLGGDFNQEVSIWVQLRRWLGGS